MYFMDHFAFKKSMLFCIVIYSTNLTRLNRKREEEYFYIVCCTVHVRTEMLHLLADHFLCFLFHAVLFQVLSSLAQKPHFTGSCFEIIQSKSLLNKWQVTQILLIDNFQRNFVPIGVIFQKVFTEHSVCSVLCKTGSLMFTGYIMQS
jgi:hypothetical protein